MFSSVLTLLLGPEFPLFWFNMLPFLLHFSITLSSVFTSIFSLNWFANALLTEIRDPTLQQWSNVEATLQQNVRFNNEDALFRSYLHGAVNFCLRNLVLKSSIILKMFVWMIPNKSWWYILSCGFYFIFLSLVVFELQAFTFLPLFVCHPVYSRIPGRHSWVMMYGEDLCIHDLCAHKYVIK